MLGLKRGLRMWNGWTWFYFRQRLCSWRWCGACAGMDGRVGFGEEGEGISSVMWLFLGIFRLEYCLHGVYVCV